MLDLNPKVRAALIAAVITAAVSVAATLKDVYPDNPIVKLAVVFVPVIAGYWKTDTSRVDNANPDTNSNAGEGEQVA